MATSCDTSEMIQKEKRSEKNLKRENEIIVLIISQVFNYSKI